MSDVILTVKNLCKSFGPTRANDHINFEVSRGEIRALAGENGSGKSTLLSQLAGIQPWDSGEVWLNGEPYKPESPQDANAKKVSMVVQELGVVGNLSAGVNVYLGCLEKFSTCDVVNLKAIYKNVQSVIDKWGLSQVPLHQLCDNLSVEERKVIEIVRALSVDPDILILDEVTQSLSLNNRQRLYSIIESFKKDNKTVIMISHDLEEVMEIADTVTVLRDGQVVDTKNVDDITLNELKTMMIGREVSGEYYREDNAPSYEEEKILEVRNLTIDRELENVSFDVHAGEILGFCGLSDSGIHTIGKALYGLVPCENKEAVHLIPDDLYIRKSTQGLNHKVAYLPKERDGEGLMMQATIKDNLVLPSLKELSGRLGFLNPKKLADTAQAARKDFSVKSTGIDQLMSGLSGGNKQKVNLGRWMIKDIRLLILDSPTRGVDIGVKSYIYSLMREAKKQGIATVLISDELTEVLGMADRVMVVKRGQIMKEIPRGDGMTEEAVIEVMV